MALKQTFHIEWDAHEYEHKERSADWFWAVGIIVAAIALVSVIFGNIIFAILIVIATVALSLFINRPPEEVHIVVDERGVTKDRTHYPYQTLDSFWIDEDHPHKKILIKSEKLFMPLIIVPLSEDVDLEKLHARLSNVLDEEYHSLPLVEKILEYLGF